MDLIALLTRRVGAAAEDAVAAQLRRTGCSIIARNARGKLGEIDIVVRDKDTIVFVEVRSRRAGAPVAPRETITEAKRRRLARLAESYLRDHGWVGRRTRIDIAEVYLSPEGKPERVEFLKAAVGE